MERPNGDFAERLTAALTARGLGLERVSSYLAAAGISCSPATISMWSNGRTRPRRGEALRAVAELERILNTPAGYLTQGAPRPLMANGDVPSGSTDPEFLVRARREMRLSAPGDVQRVFVHELVRVDEAGRYVGARIRQVLRGVAEETVNIAVFSRSPDTFGPEAPPMRFVQPEVGATRGQVREWPELGHSITELVLDEPLHRDELVSVEYDVLPQGGPEPSSPHRGEHRMRAFGWVGTLLLEVQFSERGLPDRATLQSCDVGPPEHAEPDPVDLRGNVATAGLHDLDGGGLLLRWEWGP